MSAPISGKGTHELIGELRKELNQRKLLPDDVTLEELTWLLHNHPVFRRFVDYLIADAEERVRRHILWEARQ